MTDDAELPLGPPADATPALPPGPVVLTGAHGRIEKLDPDRHAPALWAALEGHDRVWTYMASGPFADAATFTEWLAAQAKSEDPYFYAILDSRGRALGALALMAIRPSMRVIEVGHVIYSPELQRSALATEAQFLLANYAFETLFFRRYEWKCNALNARSRRAAWRLGFTFEGIFRQHMIVKWRSRDTAWYAMLDSEWPARKATFQRWLDPENFEHDGRQRKSMSAFH